MRPPPENSVTRSTAYKRRRSAVDQHRDRAHSMPDSQTGAFAASRWRHRQGEGHADDPHEDDDRREHDGRTNEAEAATNRGTDERPSHDGDEKPGGRGKESEVRARRDRHPSQHEKCGGEHDCAEGGGPDRPARARGIHGQTDRDAA